MKKSLLVFLQLFLSLFLFMSCELFFESGVTFNDETFEKEYKLWKETDLSDYSFIYSNQDTSFGYIMLKITVSEGIGSSEALDEYSTHYDKIKSIDDVFEYIKERKSELESLRDNNKRYEFSMTFDETYHYPLKIEINTEHRYHSFRTTAGYYYETITVSDFLDSSKP